MIRKNDRTIDTLEAWFAHAPPAHPGHWKDHHSAKELARVWLEYRSPALPPEIAAALVSHAAFGPVRTWMAEPEARLPFDDLPGNTRNTDLLVDATDDRGRFLLAIEGKAGEPFDQPLAKTLAAAQRRLVENPRSGGIRRVEALVRGLFGSALAAEPALGNLRYQLLTATAGALAAGRRAGVARVVLLVHSFDTPATRPADHARNAADLDAFVGRLSGGTIGRVPAGTVVGPVRGVLPREVPFFFVGKARRELRQ